MKIGILTGGGDVPGLNACIKAAVTFAREEGHEIVGIRRGWQGLVTADPDDPATLEESFEPLGATQVRTVDRSGGTFLHTSRMNPARVKPDEVPAFLAEPWPAKARST